MFAGSSTSEQFLRLGGLSTQCWPRWRIHYLWKNDPIWYVVSPTKERPDRGWRWGSRNTGMPVWYKEISCSEACMEEPPPNQLRWDAMAEDRSCWWSRPWTSRWHPQRMMTGAFSQNIRKVFSKIKLVAYFMLEPTEQPQKVYQYSLFKRASILERAMCG